MAQSEVQVHLLQPNSPTRFHLRVLQLIGDMEK